jgi:hypothetical protein
MQICTQTKKRISQVGTYKPKRENVQKLKIYLNKIKNES